MSQRLTPGDRTTPWRDELPEHWPVAPLKAVARINVRKLSESTEPGLPLRYVDISSVSSMGEIGEGERLLFEGSPSRARRLPNAGDTIVSTVRTYLRAIAFVRELPDDETLVCSTGFAVVSPRDSMDPRYLFYWLRSDPVVDEVCARSVGVSYPAINPSDFDGLPTSTPPLPVQCAIADFLDKKTAAIDALIAKKERLIELLEEKRQALITQAVTKGLDPNVPMKDSGIEWLGEIPAHWNVEAVKRLAVPGYRTFTDGDWVESPFITDEGVRLVQTGNVGIGTYREKGFRYVSYETFKSLRCTEVSPGDVLICRLDGPVGRACVVPDLGVRMITSVDIT